MKEALLDILPFLESGIVYGIGALGLAVVFRYLNFPDFTVLGSIMLGGVATVFFSNLFGVGFGLVAGCTCGALLGLCTGLMKTQLKVPPVLAGIIVFTASHSAGYLLSESGTIGLKSGDFFLEPIFSRIDLAILVFIGLTMCIVVATIMHTKWGLLLLAMDSEGPYLTYRHKYSDAVFVVTVVCANSIVGLAGGLYAINERAAHVQTHMDFLPFALGAVFAGQAITKWAARQLNEYSLTHEDLSSRKKNRTSGFSGFIAQLFHADNSDSTRILILLITYVFGCTVFTVLAGTVRSGVFFSVPAELQGLVVAVLMTVFVVWAKVE